MIARYEKTHYSDMPTTTYLSPKRGTIEMTDLKNRMEWLLQILTQPAETQTLNHYQRQLLEEELEELEAKAADYQHASA
jgi:chromosome condensin MukBEF ATPase and DNA-binding subunit MukB